MTKRELQMLCDAVSEKGLRVDAKAQTAYGRYRGYLLAVRPGPRSGAFSIITSVCASGELPDPKLLRAGAKESPVLSSATVNRFCVSFAVKASPFSIKKTMSRLPQALDNVVAMLARAGYVNCCQDTGSTYDLDIYMCGVSPAVLNGAAFARRSESVVREQQSLHLKNENVIGGAVGALLGSLIGALAIVLIGQLGYVSALCGLIMAVCTVKGYELLGGKISRRGVIIGVIIMALMVYVGHRVDWALSISRELKQEGYNIDIFTAFSNIPYWLSEDILDKGAYYGNMALIYLFTALGAFSVMKNSFSPAPLEAMFYRLGSSAEAQAQSYELEDEPLEDRDESFDESPDQ